MKFDNYGTKTFKCSKAVIRKPNSDSKKMHQVRFFTDDFDGVDYVSVKPRVSENVEGADEVDGVELPTASTDETMPKYSEVPELVEIVKRIAESDEPLNIEAPLTVGTPESEEDGSERRIFVKDNDHESIELKVFEDAE